MKTLIRTVAFLFGLLLVVVMAHFALIEIGREVVTLRTQNDDGTWHETRLWIVDVDGAPWLHSAGPGWARRFEDSPVVELMRAGQVHRFTAVAVPGPHPRIDDALRSKYGVADRWVRLIAPCDESTIPVRLESLPPDG